MAPLAPTCPADAYRAPARSGAQLGLRRRCRALVLRSAASPPRGAVATAAATRCTAAGTPAAAAPSSARPLGERAVCRARSLRRSRLRMRPLLLINADQPPTPMTSDDNNTRSSYRQRAVVRVAVTTATLTPDHMRTEDHLRCLATTSPRPDCRPCMPFQHAHRYNHRSDPDHQAAHTQHHSSTALIASAAIHPNRPNR